MKRRLIFLGPPGSGKGTVAARLQAECGLPHVSSGHLLRREAESGSVLGTKARGFLDRGELVPDEVVLELMCAWLNGAPLKSGFIFDGFPRTLQQGIALDEWLGKFELPVEAVVLFECSVELALDRISGRRSCPGCGRVYHIHSLPPKQHGVCDDCGQMLTQRADDNEAVIRRRFDVYHKLTEPLTGYYERQGKLAVVDAGGSADERFARSLAVISK